jgi:hypothetical protein
MQSYLIVLFIYEIRNMTITCGGFYLIVAPLAALSACCACLDGGRAGQNVFIGFMGASAVAMITARPKMETLREHFDKAVSGLKKADE